MIYCIIQHFLTWVNLPLELTFFHFKTFFVNTHISTVVEKKITVNPEIAYYCHFQFKSCVWYGHWGVGPRLKFLMEVKLAQSAAWVSRLAYLILNSKIWRKICIFWRHLDGKLDLVFYHFFSIFWLEEFFLSFRYKKSKFQHISTKSPKRVIDKNCNQANSNWRFVFSSSPEGWKKNYEFFKNPQRKSCWPFFQSSLELWTKSSKLAT